MQRPRGPYMTEQRYIDNRLVTERDLQDGTFDGE